MANYVVELREANIPEVIIGYAVYQSAAMAMFDPIFHNADENRARLQAECFAEALNYIFPSWSTENQSRIAAAIVLEIIDRYGEDRQQVGLAVDDRVAIRDISHAAYRRVLRKGGL